MLTKCGQSGIILDMDNNSTNVPKYELLGYDDMGNEIRLYQDGRKRNQKGQLLELPSDLESHQITSDNAHLRLQQRKQKILDAIEKSVMTVTRTNVPADAIGAIVAKRAEIAMTDDTRTGNEAARIVLQAIDAYQNRVTDSQQTVNNVYKMDAETLETLRRIASIRSSAQNDDVIDVD